MVTKVTKVTASRSGQTEQLLDLMEQVAAHLRSPTVEDWAELELTKPQLRVLLLLHGGPHRMGQLAAALGTSLPSATSLVDRMVGRGLVERATDPADRRVVVCRLSPVGRTEIERLRRSGRDRLIALVERLSPAELALAVQGLQVLAGAAARREASTEPAAPRRRAPGDRPRRGEPRRPRMGGER